MTGPVMRLDVVTIFPDYLAPLDLSLIGKARADGLLDVRVTDLRDFTHDRHRTVDDTPYGGGAGMVMKPEPWAQALDAALADAPGAEPGRTSEARPVLVVPGPGGERFTQDLAYELAREPWLVFACGRYEGIDERVYDHARDVLGPERVRIVSLGDYVLNGGEVAVLAIVEAVARLVPGVIGNEASLDEESHTGGLLEYPVYTKPASWRGRDVPPVLLSGDHGRIAAWRHEQRLARTAQRRPDLLPPAALTTGVGDGELVAAEPADAGELLTLVRACLPVAPGREPATVQDVLGHLGEHRTWVLRSGGRILGAVSARSGGGSWSIGCLVVAPDVQGRGIGRSLLEYAQAAAPDGVRAIEVARPDLADARGAKLLRKAGYRPVRGGGPDEVRVRRSLRR